ncbi:NAD(P)/FAD-dependent oxidoreductase [Gluconobacter albidus]|uniref:NAD(P)/FAD-dependent oxidoreductase n=1 Tax=Gluconobacter albidus TaxID=318683 RepID=UPI001B8B97D3|nr:FAD-binding oxidoreductase [Gluconobacter albidus]MBS1027043.1 FAD-binding oxidoreductase [Gluconobacter albidus]
MPDVVVIGCGISGAATAWELAKAGRSVTLVDQYGPASMASGWTLAGVRQSGRHPAELPLAMEAVKIWQGLDEALEASTGYTQKGNLRIGLTPEDLPALQVIAKEGQAAGLFVEVLSDAQAVRDIAPALSPAIAGATWCPTDGHADPDATVNAYVSAARRLGVETLFGEAVLSLETRNGRICGVRTASRSIPAGGVVLATGIGGNDLLAPFGCALPVDVRNVTVVRTRPLPPLLSQVLSVASACNSDAACAGRQQLDGAFRFTSGIKVWDGLMREERGRPVVAPTVGSLLETLQSFGDVVPAVRDAEIDAYWCGLVDQTPDALPVLDHVPGVEGLVMARGFSGHGFCLGPLTGKIMAALVQGEVSAVDISAFAFSRFSAPAASSSAPVTLHG